MNFLRYNEGRNYIHTNQVEYVYILNEKIKVLQTVVNNNFEEEEVEEEKEIDVMHIKTNKNAEPIRIPQSGYNSDFNHNIRVLEYGKVVS